MTTRDSFGEQVLAVFPDGRVEALTDPQPDARTVTSTTRAAKAQQPEIIDIPAVRPGLPTLNDFLQSRPAAAVGPATMGWRATAHRLSGGLIPVPPSTLELRHRNAVDRIQQSLRGPRTVVVINPKGGAHKTTATLLLAATFGTLRGGYTLAWDNNETRGTLGWRSQPARHTNTAVDLLRDLDRFNDLRNARVGDLDNYVRAQGSTQFDVLASDEDAAASSTIDAEAFNELHTTLSRFYRVIVVDTGNNMRASNWEAALTAADQLVIVSTIREDTAASAAWLVDGLREKGHEEKVRNAVTVLASPAKVADPQLSQRLHGHFTSLTRAVLDVPFDPALVDGGTLKYDALTPATREAWLQVAAAVADGL
jgi:putative peptide zinc metalloprotease protein